MFFFRKKQEALPHRDIHAEAALGISNAAKVLPANRFMGMVYLTILDNKQLSIADIEALANRLSRLAWERGRR